MTPEELHQILARNEGPKLDFKFTCYRFDAPDKVKRDEAWDEFRKDILALATRPSPDFVDRGLSYRSAEPNRRAIAKARGMP